MKKMLKFVLVVTATGITAAGCQQSSETDDPNQALESLRVIPTFRSDSGWPDVPDQWRLGEVSSIGIDAQNNAWFLHRPWTLPADEIHMAAPQVLGFDSVGSFLSSWGGPGEGYEWPQREHGLHIDHQGYVWVGGNNCPTGNEPGLEPVGRRRRVSVLLQNPSGRLQDDVHGGSGPLLFRLPSRTLGGFLAHRCGAPEIRVDAS